jgi:hypothetical protein
MSGLGPCFRAPRHAPDVCPHDDAWRFAWVVVEPVVEARGVRERSVMLVRCMACGTVVSEGEIKTPQPETEHSRRRRRKRT